MKKVFILGGYGDAGYEALDPRVVVGILSHELGHYINDARDKEREQFYADKMRDNYDVAAIVGVTKEAEAAYNNWKIAREIYENNGSLISVLGDRPDYVSAPGYDIYHMLTKVYDSNV